VLDLGCGIGSDTLTFSLFGAKVTAIELSPESLKVAKKGAKVYQQRVKFYQGNIEELSKFLPKQKFDLIYTFGVLHHTPYPERVIKEIKKYCHKDTTIKIMLYHKWSWKAFKLWLKDRSFTNSEAQQKCPLTRAYSKHQARKLLKDFKIKEVKIDFIFPYKIDKYIRYEYEKVWYWSILECFKKIIGWHLLITI
jgi:SAM-dependent methyltransferase